MRKQFNLQVKHELVRRGGKIRFRKFHRGGAEHFNLRISVEGSDVGDLESVEYELHPTFPSPLRKVTKREGGFPLDIWTWGEFEIPVTFYFQDGAVAGTRYQLEYSNELPAGEEEYVDETPASVKGGGAP